jgi:hypothetical protein
MNAANCRCPELEDEEMNSQQVVTGLTIAIVLVAAIASQARQTQVAVDPVLASFDRALSHEAVPAAPAARADIDSDVLYELVNQPLQTRDATLRGMPADIGANND